MEQDGSVEPVHAVLPVAQPPSTAVAADQLVQAAFGLAAVVTEVVVGALANPSGTSSGNARRAGGIAPAVDFAFGAAWVTTRTTGRVIGAFTAAAAPLVDLALDPPGVPRVLRPISAVQWVSHEWQSERPAAIRSLQRFTTRAAPDAAGTAVDLLPVALITDRVLERLDVDRIVASAVQHVDLDAVTIDVVSRMDLDPVVEAVVAQLDLEAIVADVLSRLDLTSIVVEQVDLKRVITVAMQESDLTSLVKEQVDLIDLADYVVDGIDLQEIIRESTGSIASTAVQTVRLQSVEADEIVNRIVDKALFRRRARKTQAPKGNANRPVENADDTSASEGGAANT